MTWGSCNYPVDRSHSKTDKLLLKSEKQIQLNRILNFNENQPLRLLHIRFTQQFLLFY